MADSALSIRLIAKNEARKAIREAMGDLQDLEKQTDRTGASFTKMAGSVVAGLSVHGVISSFADAVRSAASAGIEFNSTVEQAQVAFSVMTGSADTARQHIEDLKKFALKTPFEFTDLLAQSKALQAYGIAVQDIIPTIETLGNIAAGVGMDKLPQLTMAYGQVRAATKLTGAELRQFTEAGVPLLGELAAMYNTTTAEMVDMISEGRVGFESVSFALDRLAKGDGAKFGNMMELQSQTFAGAMSNLSDAAQQTAGAALKPLTDALRDAAMATADLLSTDGGPWAAAFAASLQQVGGALSWLGDRAREARALVDWMGQIPGVKGAAESVPVIGQAMRMTELATNMGKAADAARRLRTEEADANDELRATANVSEQAASAVGKLPPPLLDTEKAARKAAGGVRELERSIADLLNEALTLKAAMPGAEALVGAGDLQAAAEALVAAGMSNSQAVREALSIQDRLAREAEKSMREAAEAARQLAEEQKRAAEEAARAWDDRSKNMGQSIMDALKAGKSAVEGTAKFFKDEWLKSLEEDITGVARKVRDAMRDGLDPTDLLRGAEELFRVYAEAIRGIGSVAEENRLKMQADTERGIAQHAADVSRTWMETFKEQTRVENAQQAKAWELLTFGKPLADFERDAATAAADSVHAAAEATRRQALAEAQRDAVASRQRFASNVGRLATALGVGGGIYGDEIGIGANVAAIERVIAGGNQYLGGLLTQLLNAYEKGSQLDGTPLAARSGAVTSRNMRTSSAMGGF